MSGTETLWQELICRLEGVQAAQVVFAENGMPCEIHVLAGPEKSSKSLVRDIQSALTAQFGVQVDHRIISVAQLSEGLVPRGGFPSCPYGAGDQKRGRACVCFGNAGARLRHVYRPRRKREYAFCPATVRFRGRACGSEPRGG